MTVGDSVSMFKLTYCSMFVPAAELAYFNPNLLSHNSVDLVNQLQFVPFVELSCSLNWMS